MVSLILFVSVAAAPGSELAAAIGAYERLDFRGARATLVRLLDDPDLSRRQRIEALAYLGRAHAVLGEPVRAQRRFEAVLALAPDYTVAWEESPKIREVFARAQEARAKRQPQKPPPMDTKAHPKPPVRTHKPEPRRSKAKPPGPTPPEPTSPPTSEEGSFAWRIAGGVALTVALAAVVTVLALDPGGDEQPAPTPTDTWRLP